MNDISGKWRAYYWNDREVLQFRRNVGQLIQRFQNELQLTLQGNYARQVAASFVFYATTAPGESMVAAILRYKMNTINMRVIEEIQLTRDRIQNARDQFYGYRKSPRVYQPFG